MKWIQVGQTQGLRGTIKIPGSKNSSLALLAATCLADEPVILEGIPDIYDYRVISQIGADIGLIMHRDLSGAITLDPRKIHNTWIDPEKASSYRASYYFVGALLAKFGKVTIGVPGGDDFVSRPIDQHIKALQMMGAAFTFYPDSYEVHAPRLVGADIYFDTITCGGTINIMLAAVRAKGQTILRNAAADPEVVDTANLLIQMGARIYGAGTGTVRIEGVTHLSGCTYMAIPDRLIAGAFLMTAGIRNGSITVEDIIPEHLEACISKLTEVGVQIEIGDNSITASSTGILKATRVRTAMYPGFATDLQQPLTALLTQASGKSLITEMIYPKRFNHVNQLNRMGAAISMRGQTAYIKGATSLQGNLVHATDVRAGICLIMAGLIAEGTTVITGVQHIERGYENIIGALTSLGANIASYDSSEESFENMHSHLKLTSSSTE